MTFERAWALFLILLPVAWAAWEWRASTRRLALLLKTAAFVAILLALAEPRLTVYQSKVAAAVLVDTSASVSPDDLRTESTFAAQVEKTRGRNWTRVMPFARNTRNAAAEEHIKDGWQLRHTAGAPGHGE